MKLKECVELKEVAGVFIVLGGANSSLNLSQMITLNKSGDYLFGLLKNDKSKEDLIKALLDKYDVDEKTAKKDVDLFIDQLSSLDILIWTKS